MIKHWADRNRQGKEHVPLMLSMPGRAGRAGRQTGRQDSPCGYIITPVLSPRLMGVSPPSTAMLFVQKGIFNVV